MIYWPVRFLTKCIFKIFYNFKVYGAENIPEKGPYLVCTNHCSFFDPLVISSAIPYRVWWVVLKDLYRIWPLNIFLRVLRCIPVNGAIGEAMAAITQGKVIGIFPEGRRTYTGILMRRAKKGAVILAMRTGAVILPGWISGTFYAYPRRAKFPKIYPLSVRFGKPIKFSVRKENFIDEEIVKAAGDKILSSIAGLSG